MGSSLIVEEETTCGRDGRPGRRLQTRENLGSIPRFEGENLAAEPEPSDDGPVARVVLLDEIGKKTTALANELEEAATGMVVLGEAPEMVGQPLDPLRQERNLDLRRPGVTFLGGIPGHDLLLLFPR
jgi:hypothetical protein